jgi:large subunit ribosomal protein L9
VRVILRNDVDKLGRTGDVLEVADGFARNYLLPRKLALAATPDNERRITKERRLVVEKQAAGEAALKELAAKLAALRSVNIQARADGETLYGSVGAPEIVAALAAEHGLTIPAEAVKLAEPIKKVGTHDVLFRLAEGAEATVKVWVLPEETDQPAAETK